MSLPVAVQTIYNGRVIDLGLEEHRLPNGRQSSFEIIRHPGGAAVLPILPDGRLLLIRQYRPAIGRMVFEIPAGRIDPGEAPLDCAARELVEETGFRATELTPLGSLLSAVGFCDERVDLFVATGLVETESAPEIDEVIELAPIALEQALRMIEADELLDSKTLVALLRYARREELQP